MTERLSITIDIFREPGKPNRVLICTRQDDLLEQHWRTEGEPVSSQQITRLCWKLIRQIIDNSIFADDLSKERRYGPRDQVRLNREIEQLDIRFGPLEDYKHGA